VLTIAILVGMVEYRTINTISKNTKNTIFPAPTTHPTPGISSPSHSALPHPRHQPPSYYPPPPTYPHPQYQSLVADVSKLTKPMFRPHNNGRHGGEKGFLVNGSQEQPSDSHLPQAFWTYLRLPSVHPESSCQAPSKVVYSIR